MQAKRSQKQRYYDARIWASARGLSVPVAELPLVLKDLIQEWFSLVSTAGSGTLSADELAHMFAVRIPLGSLQA